MNHSNSKESYVFQCDQWLSTDDGDRKTYKILQPYKSLAMEANGRKASVSPHADGEMRRKSLTGTPTGKKIPQ